MSRAKKIYLGGAITHAGDEQVLQWYQDITETLEKIGYEVFLPHRDVHLPKHKDEQDIHAINMKAIKHADLVIAYVGIPSLGVGMVLQRAQKKMIPTILLAEENSTLSEMILHTANIKTIIRFHDKEDAISQLVTQLS
jgi:2'-deoxynucleoside 5'-phosphate N-hydrolase